MKVEVRVPEEYLGAVVGDLNSRRGEVGEVGLFEPAASLERIRVAVVDIGRGRVCFDIVAEDLESGLDLAVPQLPVLGHHQAARGISGWKFNSFKNSDS